MPSPAGLKAKDRNTDSGSEARTCPNKGTERKGNVFFPLLMYEIVSDKSTDDIIRWLPSGRAFIIKDKKRFSKEILPRYFSQQSLYTSFTRKLTRWDFKRIPRGPFIGVYYNDFFQKGAKELCYRMTCSDKKKLIVYNPKVFGTGTSGQIGHKPTPTSNLQTGTSTVPLTISSADLRLLQNPVPTDVQPTTVLPPLPTSNPTLNSVLIPPTPTLNGSYLRTIKVAPTTAPMRKSSQCANNNSINSIGFGTNNLLNTFSAPFVGIQMQNLANQSAGLNDYFLLRKAQEDALYREIHAQKVHNIARSLQLNLQQREEKMMLLQMLRQQKGRGISPV